MTNSLTIPKDLSYPPSMDWITLKREGIQHIERLGSDIWTDYNMHDPGITILDILCYAITDLGYRANMDPKDLFADESGRSFISAAKILSCGPVTALDMRKLLIDIPGVQNAWVEQLEDAEVRFWLGTALNNELLFKTIEPYFEKVGIPREKIVFDIPPVDSTLFHNINKCQSEKDRQAAREALEEYFKTQVFTLHGAFVPASLAKYMLVYMSSRWLPETVFFLDSLLAREAPGSARVNSINLIKKTLGDIRTAYADDRPIFNWDQDLIENVADSDLLSLISAEKDIAWYLVYKPMLSLVFAGSLRFTSMPEELPDDFYNLFIPKGIYTVSLRLEQDAAGDEDRIITSALERLHRDRNLDEDIHPDIRIIEKIPMGIDLALEIDDAADALDVIARVYRAIGQYLAPDIRFYSLEEMMNRWAVFEITTATLEELLDAMLPATVIAATEKLLGKVFTGNKSFRGAVAELLSPDDLEDYYDDIFLHSSKIYDSDQVYKGPLLQHGFIDEEELISSQPRQTVYRSDLYQIISEVEGVLQIERLEIYRCDRDDSRSGNWCLQFECRCLPELSWGCSYFSVWSNGIELPVNNQKIIEYLNGHPPVVTKINREGMLDLPMPNGKAVSNISAFTSTQIDFPRTYKIGTTGISKKLPEQRQAEAKQLQAYLFFYDQLMANYLAYLSNVKQLLSVSLAEGEDRAIINYQPLYDVPGIRDLLLDYLPASSWDDFIKGDNDYVSALKDIAAQNDTTNKLFISQVLDHLLARFGESFTDFAVQLYKIEKPVNSASSWEAAEGLDEVIADKERFLRNIADIGSGRATGFNYFGGGSERPKYWNTSNVEGVKRRVCAVLGIQDIRRHTITCEPMFLVESGAVRNPAGTSSARPRYEFFIRERENNIRLLVSTAKFSNPETAEHAKLDFLNMSVDRNGYGIINDNIIGFWPNVEPDARTTANALLLELRENPENIERRLKHIQDLATGNCEDDGFHIIEHILLRPRSDAYSALLNPMISCIAHPEFLDPYSFWISVIVPDWTGRFSEPKRLEAFMQTVRREMPAHLAVRFCSLSRENMFRFEKQYNDWLKQLCAAQQNNLPEATDELVNLMNGWEESTVQYF